MKKSFIHKLAALLLAAAFTGCQAVTAVAPPKAEPKTSELVDTAIAEEYPFESEYPAIDADMTFHGELAVQSMAARKAPAEVKAVWISFLEMQTLLTNKTETQFRRNMQTVFDNVKDLGLNMVVIQVRPYADALYKSRYFPWSFLITGTEGEDPGFDPFEIMVEEARARNLRIEAWVNPYRIRPADRKDALCETNQAKIWLDEKDDSVINYNGVISYNPASTKAQDLIVKGMVELVKNYDIDGIHLDDYFYPTTDKNFDKASYAAYTKNGGKLSLEDWRRSNVEKLLKKAYTAVKSVNKNLVFGVSPQSSVSNNYNGQFLDVKKIAANSGYCDYLCPQIYFGFDNAAQPYSQTLADWNEMVTAPGVKLYIGLAAYKVGAVDSWAGSGKNEWVKNTDMLKRMTIEAREQSKYAGIILFRYDFLFKPPSNVKSAAQKEVSNLKGILK